MKNKPKNTEPLHIADVGSTCRFVYFLEHKEKTGWWLTGKEHGYKLTRNPEKAMRFDGKDAKEHAKLYLGLNQAAGTLKDFVVTEHEFV